MTSLLLSLPSLAGFHLGRIPSAILLIHRGFETRQKGHGFIRTDLYRQGARWKSRASLPATRRLRDLLGKRKTTAPHDGSRIQRGGRLYDFNS